MQVTSRTGRIRFLICCLFEQDTGSFTQKHSSRTLGVSFGSLVKGQLVEQHALVIYRNLVRSVHEETWGMCCIFCMVLECCAGVDDIYVYVNIRI